MIQVSNLSKAYSTQVILDDVGFTVNAGEHIGLVGRNGHGKTTLLRMITGEARPDAGVISIPNNYTVGYLSQQLKFSEDTVLKEGCLGLKPSEDGIDESYKVETILMGLGFSLEDFSRHPLDLSGGYQVRLNMAKLLVSEPDLLLLDEPTNYLDIVSIRWLIRFLKCWKGELILITHDREFMNKVTTHTMIIHRNKIRKIAGPTDKLYEQILLEEEIYEKTRANEDKKRKEVEQFINRFRAQATRARAVQSKIKALQKKEKLEKMSGIKDLEFEFVSAPFTGKLLIEAKDLSFSFGPEGTLLIDGLDLAIGKKDRIAVIGKNGKGKTTLLNLLAGELKPLEGTVTHHPKLKLAYFGQTNIQRLTPEKTVEEEILDAFPSLSRSAARNICGIMMFSGDNALKKVSVLSGGEKSRVLLAKLIVSPANLLLLDEPTNHLDMESVDSLLEAIEAFKGAVMIVTHSEMILHAAATRLIVFDDERVRVFEGTYQDFLDRGGWKDEGEVVSCAKHYEDKKNNGKNKKGLKKIKAELIDTRSRTLTPLQLRISEVEETISQIEKIIEQDTQALVRASEKGAWESIQQYSGSIHESRGKIEILFDELEALTSELEMKTREFEERLEMLRPVEG
jgi:ATP-binding cassette, subfamily F, member 3